MTSAQYFITPTKKVLFMTNTFKNLYAFNIEVQRHNVSTVNFIEFQLDDKQLDLMIRQLNELKEYKNDNRRTD